MKRYADFIGIAAICLGIAVMAICYFAGFSSHNWTGFLALIFIIGGACYHFRRIKRASRY